MSVTSKGDKPLHSAWGRGRGSTLVRRPTQWASSEEAKEVIWVDWFFDASTPSVTAALTGTATAGINETDIVAGGKTIIITLTGDTWVTSGATFDGQRQNIINGIDSGQSEGTGWDAVVKALQGVAGVVRTSDTVVTVTLDAQATYNITAQETITVTIPATALTLAGSVVATPTFTVSHSVVSAYAPQLMMMGVG